jgi:hypothetical protein
MTLIKLINADKPKLLKHSAASYNQKTKPLKHGGTEEAEENQNLTADDADSTDQR